MAVVMLIRVVGLILIMALLTIPSSLAETRSKSLGAMMIRACFLSAVFCLLGLWGSLTLNLTSGASIIAVASLTFFADFFWRRTKHALGK
jgi:zinc transport system permease protein